jgi:hypothetical protein
VTFALPRNIDLAAVKFNPGADGRTAEASSDVVESLAERFAA